MPHYPIISIPLEAREDTEQLGSKPKFWVLIGQQRWLFKEARPNTGEDWAEKAAAEIAHAIAVNAAKVELAEYDGKVGCISCNFVNVDAGEALVHGNEIMAWSVTGYDKEKIFRQADHTLDNIQLAIRALAAFADIDTVLTELAGYMVLDALIGNTDRHHENWGLRSHRPVVQQARMLSAAPSFDHASSLGRELLDSKRSEILKNQQIARYSSKGQGGIFRDAQQAHGENPLRLVQVAARAYPSYFRPAIARVAALDAQAVSGIFQRLPPERASEPAKQFAQGDGAPCAHHVVRFVDVNEYPEMSTLFVAWQAPNPSRAWFPIGRLDASVEHRDYVFQYTHGALQAREHAGFSPLLAFPEFERRYEASELFPLFKNRILEPNRKDFAEYLGWLDLDPAHADPIEILSLTGGERQTDSLEVFPQTRKMADGTVHFRFFLHGLRHVSPAAQARADVLEEGETLQVAVEVNNPATGYAVQLQTRDGHLIGWAPRYLVSDLRAALLEHATITATVRRINRLGAPFARRVLIELQGGVPAHFEPMTSEEYRVLAA